MLNFFKRLQMLRVTDIRLPFNHSDEELTFAIASKIRVKPGKIISFQIIRKSIDARKGGLIFFVYTVDVDVQNENAVKPSPKISPSPVETYQLPKAASKGGLRPVIVGTGPCGLFAGLILAQAGFSPILLERGKPAKERARDVHEFWNTGTLDAASNVQFGEGGAGTFSDGKLTTRIKDKAFRCTKVLGELVQAGAPEEILYTNKPHIGTDILVKVVTNLRNRIISLGGEVRFESQVTDIAIENEKVAGVILADGQTIETDRVIIAIGHSARDTYEMLHGKGVSLQAKAFSIGARIEHPQSMIDKIQFGKFSGYPKLGRAEYRLSHRCENGRGVYTFCMCPGGQVIGASSEAGGVVTNGMSAFARNKPNANSGLVVGVTPEDFGDAHPLAGIEFQRKWERAAFKLGGGDYKAPVQLVKDFLKAKTSKNLRQLEPSYKPGVQLCDLAECLPAYVVNAMREGIVVFDKKLPGFAMRDAVLTGVETRTSAPVRILRGDDFQSTNTAGLYPAGEGAGYAGGIISAAVDGIKVAEAICAINNR